MTNPDSTKPTGKFEILLKTYSTVSNLDNLNILEYKGTDLTITASPGSLALINKTPLRNE